MSEKFLCSIGVEKMNVEMECRICGSKKIYCVQETYLKDKPFAIVHVGYCERCAKDIELFELQLRIRSRNVSNGTG